MSLLSKIGDRIILFPTTEPINPPSKTKRWVEIPEGRAEVWESEIEAEIDEAKKISVLKFTGNAGRAENVSNQPFSHLSDVSGTVWAVNQCGYGGSSGFSSLKNFATTCRAAFETMRNEFPDRPILVCGNSIGCLSALWVASNCEVNGVFLRNPPPLRQMIAGRLVYNWWNLGFAQLIARSVPTELDCIKNAASCSAPLLFVQSLEDRVVPIKFQNMIFAAYAGVKRRFDIPGADHHEGVPSDMQSSYLKEIRWLFKKGFESN